MKRPIRHCVRAEPAGRANADNTKPPHHTRTLKSANRIEANRVDPNRAEPNRTEPNRIASNRIEPNRTEPNGTERNRTKSRSTKRATHPFRLHKLHLLADEIVLRLRQNFVQVFFAQPL